MNCKYCEDKGYWYSYDGWRYACENCKKGALHEDEKRPPEPSNYRDI